MPSSVTVQILSASPGHTSLSAAETQTSSGSISVALHTRCFDQSEGSLQGPAPFPSPLQPGTVSWGDPKPGGQFNPRQPLSYFSMLPLTGEAHSGLHRALFSHTSTAVQVVVPGVPSHPRCSFIGSAGCLLSNYYRPSTGQGGGQQTHSSSGSSPPAEQTRSRAGWR